MSRTMSRVPVGGSVSTGVMGEKRAAEPGSVRRSPRIGLQIPVFVRGVDASGCDFIELTKTFNISSLGACIASEHFLRPRQTVHLTIPVPSPATPGLVPSETPPIIARVLRQSVVGQTRLFGLEFVHPLE
jgi:PilZ domain